MSFRSLLRHQVRIVRQVAVLSGGDPTYDELGQPITAPSTVSTWPCRIQPRTAREVAQLSQAGAVVADHIIYGEPTDLEEGDRLEETTTDRVFQVESIADGGGSGHHYEVVARRIAGSTLHTS